jgi:hypothetical protein
VSITGRVARQVIISGIGEARGSRQDVDLDWGENAVG